VPEIELAVEAEGRSLMAGDGVPWIWDLTQDPWAGATQVPDFHHASQHLWHRAVPRTVAARRRRRAGWNHATINSGTGKNSGCCARLRGWKCQRAGPGKSFVVNRAVLRARARG